MPLVQMRAAQPLRIEVCGKICFSNDRTTKDAAVLFDQMQGVAIRGAHGSLYLRANGW